MKAVIFLIGALFSSICFSATNSIDISCTYKTLSTDEDINKIKQAHLDFELVDSKWANFIKGKKANNVMSFSINLQNGSVTNGLSIHDHSLLYLDPYIASAYFVAKIYPDFIVLVGYPKDNLQSNSENEWSFKGTSRNRAN